jgi:hypothetical protein
MKLTDQQKVEVVEKYLTGKYTCKQLCDEYKMSSAGISYFMKKRNIKINRHFLNVNRKYTLNQNYFDIIDTEERAYFLGLLYADGYNNEPKYLISIGLQERDIKILEKFNKSIDSNRPFCISKLNDKNKNHQNSIILSINSKQVSENLTKLGCHKAKSLTLKFPTDKQVPSHLIKHFIRGYFDGDGCIVYDENNTYPKCSLVSTLDFCNELKTILMNELDIKISIYNNNSKNKDITKSLEICGNNKCIKFLDWLYKDSTLYIDRKYEKYQLLLNYNHPQL